MRTDWFQLLPDENWCFWSRVEGKTFYMSCGLIKEDDQVSLDLNVLIKRLRESYTDGKFPRNIQVADPSVIWKERSCGHILTLMQGKLSEAIYNHFKNYYYNEEQLELFPGI